MKIKNSYSTKAMSILLAIVILLGMLPMSVFAAESDGVQTKLDISQGGITLGEDFIIGKDLSGSDIIQTDPDGYYIVQTTSDATTNNIIVHSGTHHLTIDGLNISGGNPIDILSGAEATITIKGENVLSGGQQSAAIHLPEGATLIFSEDSSGTITAKGGNGDRYSAGGAGIGGNGGGYWVAGENCGDLIIKGGTINAIGGNGGAIFSPYGAGAAGIGGGGGGPYKEGGNGGNLFVLGGKISAQGGDGVRTGKYGGSKKGSSIGFGGGGGGENSNGHSNGAAGTLIVKNSDYSSNFSNTILEQVYNTYYINDVAGLTLSTAEPSTIQYEYNGIDRYSDVLDALRKNFYLELNGLTFYPTETATQNWYKKAIYNDKEETDKILDIGSYSVDFGPSATQTITVKVLIGQGKTTATITIENWAWNEAASIPIVSSGNDEQIEYMVYYKTKGTEDNTYAVTVPSAIGNYTAKVVFDEINNYASTTATADFSITAADISGATITVDPTGGTYNGNAYTPAVSVTFNGSELSEGTDYTLSWDKDGFTNPDTYTATIEGKGNFTGKKTATFSIDPATLTSNDFDFTQPDNLTYDGKKKTATLRVKNTVVGAGNVTVYYKTADGGWMETAPTDVGTYYIGVTVTKGTNYNAATECITDDSWCFTIEQKEINVSWGSTEFTYDGTANKPTATTTDFVSNDDVALTVSGEQTYAGVDYTATVTITGTKADNYKFADGTATTTKFTIKKADQSKPAVQSSNETISGKQDGKITDVNSTMEYRKDGKTTYTDITGNTVENLAAGKYYVRVKGDDNHNPSDETEVIIAEGGKLAITVPQNQTGYTLTANNTKLEWHGSTTLVFELADGYSKTDEFSVSATGATLTDNGDGTYTISNAEDNVIITVRGVADTTTPEAEMSISTNKWTDFLNNITFGMFFKETQDVTITATDKGSGVDKIYYLISETVLDEDSVEALANDFWTEYDAANKPSISPDRECIVYVKVIDKAQNVKYISSDGLVFDGTAPVIIGIENGKTYYGQVVFGVTDGLAGMLKVEIDGVDKTHFEGQYVINPDNKEHTIVATDNAGNKTTYTITVNKVYEITFKHPTFELGFPVNYGASFNEAHPDTVQDMTASKDYHTFVGWYESTDGGETLKDTPYDFDTEVTDNVTLYPLFEIYTYTVTYKADGEVVGTVTVEHGKDATAPAIPEKEGYTQTAPTWDKDGKNITADTEISAVYTINEYTVTFMDENGVYKTVTVKHGEKVTMPEVPTKDGYTVTWEKEIDTVTEDTTVKAVYTEIPATDKPSSPQTGDNTNLWLWIALLFVSGGCLFGITLNERKRKAATKR